MDLAGHEAFSKGKRGCEEMITIFSQPLLAYHHMMIGCLMLWSSRAGDLPIWGVKALEFIETLSREISCHHGARPASA